MTRTTSRLCSLACSGMRHRNLDWVRGSPLYSADRCRWRRLGSATSGQACRVSCLGARGRNPTLCSLPKTGSAPCRSAWKSSRATACMSETRSPGRHWISPLRGMEGASPSSWLGQISALRWTLMTACWASGSSATARPAREVGGACGDPGPRSYSAAACRACRRMTGRRRRLACRSAPPDVPPNVSGALQRPPTPLDDIRRHGGRLGPGTRKPRLSGASRSGGTQTRTGDTTIFSRVLYQLSYPARKAQER